MTPIIYFALELRRKFGKGGEWEITPRAYFVIFAHIMAIQGVWFCLTGPSFPGHHLFGMTLFLVASLGGGAGGHRLWAHRSYKAKLPLRIFLMIGQTLLSQVSIYTWVRYHRLHHKFCETDADPHNVKRGIFFTHIGWYLIKEHPEVTESAKKIDLSDLENDPVIAFQHKYQLILEIILSHTIPVLIYYKIWQMPLYSGVCVNFIRFLVGYHLTALGNSVAHTWNRKPYERSIGPADVTWLSLVIGGEGWHNFHHVYPWDYRSTDVGQYYLNLLTAFIDLMAKAGLAYDLKTVPDHVIRKRAARTGDGSHPHLNREFPSLEKSELWYGNVDKLDVGEIGPGPWGWGDSDLPQEDMQDTLVLT